MTSSAPSELEQRVGNPVLLWDELKDRVQTTARKHFGDVQDDWLKLMWALDSFRVAGIVPPGTSAKTLGALNNQKGNWFASMLALLLQNRTNQVIGSRANVVGFSQNHQVDLAWPHRKHDPLICVETKVTGGPKYADKPERGPTADWTNRRKELKFAATDLKLYRREQETNIGHWDVWRQTASPKAYFLWGARLRSGDSIQPLLNELQVLTNTYLDGAGLFAWRQNAAADGYEPVALPPAARVTTLDDVLYRIETEMKGLLGSSGKPPDPRPPAAHADESLFTDD